MCRSVAIERLRRLYSPRLTAAFVRTVDTVVYPALLAARPSVPTFRERLSASTADHAPWTTRGGLWRECLTRSGASHQSNPVAGTAEATYNLLTFAFGLFSALAIFAPFPLATVRSLVGKELARAFGAWTLLANVVCYILKSSADTDIPPLAPVPVAMATQLQRGLLLMCATHLAVAALGACIDKAGLYPAAVACHRR